MQEPMLSLSLLGSSRFQVSASSQFYNNTGFGEVYEIPWQPEKPQSLHITFSFNLKLK